jgi:hypothetical protein
MTAVSATKMLLRIRENAAAGEPLSGEDARYFVAAVDEWLSGTEFAEAFGVKPARGEGDPRRTMIESQRDELIRTAAQRFLKYIPLRQRAEELHRAWTRYFDGAWHTRDCKLSDCPVHYAGKPSGLLFQITSLKPHVLSERQIRRILATRPPGFAATELCSKDEIRPTRHTDAAVSFQGSEAMHVPAKNAADTDWPIEFSEERT